MPGPFRSSFPVLLALAVFLSGCAGPGDGEPGSERDDSTAEDSVDGEVPSNAIPPDQAVVPGSCLAPLPLPLGITVHGDTRGRFSNGHSSCGADDASGDIAFTFEAPAAGALYAFPELPDDDGDGLPDWMGTLAVTSACGDPDSEHSCESMSYDSVTCVDAPGTLFVVVDGDDVYSIQRGDAVLLDPPETGRFGLAMRYEVCAPRQVCLPDRGCSLRVEGGTECADAPSIPLEEREPRRFAGATSGAADAPVPSCGAGAREGIYRLEAPERGRLRVVVSPPPGREVAASLRNGCDATGAELACGDMLEACVDPGPTFLVVEADEEVDRFGVSLVFDACERCSADGCLD